LVKIGFMDTRDAENDFAWPSDTFKHRFIDFTKVLFSHVQTSDYELSGPFVYLKITSATFHKSLFWMPRILN
jgi:hypothetical protein